MITRKAIASTKPDITITVNGTKFNIEQKTSLKTVIMEFTLDEPSTYDPGNVNFLISMV